MSTAEEASLEVQGATEAQAPEVGNYDEFQDVCDYRLAFKRDIASVVVSLIFGVLAILSGIGGGIENLLNAILVLLGLFLFVDGVALLAKPSPATFILDSFALGAVGVWNLGIGILVIVAGYPSRSVILGIIQIGWAIHNYKRYRKLSKLPKPSEEDVQRLDELVADIYRAKPKQRPDIIQFQIAGFVKTHVWKARLCDDVAICLRGKKEDGVFAQRHEIEIVPQKKSLGKSWKATFRLRDRVGKGTISQEHYERFKAWFDVMPELAEESALAE